jgi:hypothetical protein
MERCGEGRQGARFWREFILLAGLGDLAAEFNFTHVDGRQPKPFRMPESKGTDGGANLPLFRADSASIAKSFAENDLYVQNGTVVR